MALGQIISAFSHRAEDICSGGSSVVINFNGSTLITGELGVMPVQVSSGDVLIIRSPVTAQYCATYAYTYVDSYRGFANDLQFMSRTLLKQGEDASWGDDDNDWKLVFMDVNWGA